MKTFLQKLFAPLLRQFENQQEHYVYQRSYRVILIFVGLLFWVLAMGALTASVITGQLGGLIPFVVFFVVGLVCEVVGALGSDRAVANIWKTR